MADRTCRHHRLCDSASCALSLDLAKGEERALARHPACAAAVNHASSCSREKSPRMAGMRCSALLLPQPPPRCPAMCPMRTGAAVAGRGKRAGLERRGARVRRPGVRWLGKLALRRAPDV
eukprot:2956732-Pleurochrysis_carterae.AAC.3